MNEKFSIYDEQGKVEDPEVAKVMAKTEDLYRTQARDSVNPIEKEASIKKGEEAAESTGKYMEEGLAWEKWIKSLDNASTSELKEQLDIEQQKVNWLATILKNRGDRGQ